MAKTICWIEKKNSTQKIIEAEKIVRKKEKHCTN